MSNKKYLKPVASMLALIQRNLKISSIKTKELAYKALVRPQLEYASICIGSPWQQGLTTMIEKVQRCAARFVFNDYSYNCSVTDIYMLSKLQWDFLELRCKKSRLHIASYVL